ncbi:hypothetical protein PoB_004801200 [Plakobranchus ocellatus]|uniref:Uncharacterized protein n=1 Tax=Plakobranchus ocellatus TaxID=259542 RepID=A0AAV4BQ56_9GAST|nr:hypothetical protein PoB_004801200 [Plakobranchus ocellatus]
MFITSETSSPNVHGLSPGEARPGQGKISQLTQPQSGCSNMGDLHRCLQSLFPCYVSPEVTTEVNPVSVLQTSVHSSSCYCCWPVVSYLACDLIQRTPDIGPTVQPIHQ